MTCSHLNFDARVVVTRLTDEGGHVTGYTTDIMVNCRDCGAPFQWLGLPPGSHPAQPMVSADGLEARMPIAPAGAVPSPLHRMAGSRNRFDA
jgi:hypothetical protein